MWGVQLTSDTVRKLAPSPTMTNNRRLEDAIAEGLRPGLSHQAMTDRLWGIRKKTNKVQASTGVNPR
jgi:hypothetical protein